MVVGRRRAQHPWQLQSRYVLWNNIVLVFLRLSALCLCEHLSPLSKRNRCPRQDLKKLIVKYDRSHRWLLCSTDYQHLAARSYFLSFFQACLTSNPFLDRRKLVWQPPFPSSSMFRNEMPIRIYSFSCGLLMTQVLVFLSKGLLVGYFGILFHFLSEYSIPCLRCRTHLVIMSLHTTDIHHALWLSPGQVSSAMEICPLLFCFSSCYLGEVLAEGVESV